RGECQPGTQFGPDRFRALAFTGLTSLMPCSTFKFVQENPRSRRYTVVWSGKTRLHKPALSS
ncbi:MAG: hypothetical protein ACTS5I_03710, partial [Rhodanobacter sp.]